MRFHTRARIAATAGLPLLSIVSARVAAAQEPDSTRLPRVVITATRSATTHGAGIASTSVIDARALRDRGVTDVAAALQLVPGLHVVRSGGGPGAQVSLFMRGAESDYVRVLVDGVPVNDPGGAVDLSTWTLDGLDRIEVVRGPASVLYGSDAVAGVVQLFTQRARRPIDGTLRVAAGNFGTLVSEATIGGSRRAFSGVVGASRRRSDGIHAFNSAWWNEGLNGRGSYSTDRSSVAVSAQQHRDEFHYPTDGTGRVIDRNAFRTNRRSAISVDAAQALGATVKVMTTLSALEGRGVTDDRADGVADTLGLHTYLNRGSVRRRGAELRVTWNARPNIMATVGGEVSGEAQRSRDSSNYGGNPAFAASRTTRSAYAQIAGGTDRVQITAGARHDDNSVFGGFTTARGGATVRLHDAWRLRGSIGTAFKAPTFLEQFNTAFTTGNASLSPERGRTIEAGVVHSLNGARGDVSATWFRQRFTDLIQYTYRDQGPNYFNVARAAADGMELEGNARLTSAMRVTAAATWLETKVLDAGFDEGAGATFVNGQRLLRRPSRTATVGLIATPRGGVSLQATITRIGRRDDRDFSTFPAKPVILKAWTRTDLDARVRLMTDLEITGRVENAFDRDYQEVFGFSAMGRSLLVGVRATLPRSK